MSFPDKPTFFIKTLGCKVNQYETQAMREHLVKNGFVEKKEGKVADYYIVNSCTVTKKADRDTRNLIHRFHRVNPNGKIVVAGCYAELDTDRKELMDISGVTHLVRNNEKGKLAEILKPKCKQIPNPKLQITGFKNHNRAFIKVQDGCNHRCSYCKVSLVRGSSRSRSTSEILQEIKNLVDSGFKEVVLTGVCLGAWGQDLETKTNLADLVNKICQIDGSFRIRLSSVEPIYVTERIISVLKEGKVCKHLHVPLQSGDDRILKLMKRPYRARNFKRIIAKIRKQIPDAAITTDVLVGFPGENERQFRNTLRFIKSIKPSRMHVFSYSRRKGTIAARYADDLSKQVIKKRVKTLTDLSRKLSADFARTFVGKVQDVIVEEHRDERTGLLAGYTDRYVRILLGGADSLKNRLIAVMISGVDGGKGTVFGCLDNDKII